MNIILVGFMGTGKNAVGRLLAKQLGMEFVDMDALIEQKENRPISEIFAKSGEPYFRKVEKQMAKEVAAGDNSVIVAGGGVVLDEDNIKALKENGIMFCLTASPQTILDRTKRYQHRPLLNVEDPAARIGELLGKRAVCYARADHQIDTDNLKPEEVARKIIGIWKKETPAS